MVIEMLLVGVVVNNVSFVKRYDILPLCAMLSRILLVVMYLKDKTRHLMDKINLFLICQLIRMQIQY